MTSGDFPKMDRLLLRLGGLMGVTVLVAQLLSPLELAAGSGPRPLIDPEIPPAVQQGSARVLVELRLPAGLGPEGELPAPEAVAAKYQAIARAQADVLSRLAGTHFTTGRQYATVPYLALEIGAEALAALEGM